MSLYNTTNIKNLPQVDQIIDTDFLVVENYSGTNKLKFKDFVVGPNNTSFYTSIKTNLSELSAYDKTLTTNLSTLSSNSNTFNKAISAKLDLNLTLTSVVSDKLDQSIVETDSKIVNLTNTITITAERLQAFLDQIYSQYPLQFNKLFTFRWNLSAYSITPNYSNTFHYIYIDYPYELNITDIIYVRPIVGVDDIYNYDGTITFKLSTVFFNSGNATSTYALMLSASKPVPLTMTSGQYYPGTTTTDTTRTFACRVMTTSTLNLG